MDKALNKPLIMGPVKLVGGYTPEFSALWKERPPRGPNNNKRKAFLAYKRRLKQGFTHEQMLDGLRAYTTYCEATGKLGTEYVMMMATFFGPDCHFDQDWAFEQKTTLPKNDDELAAFAEQNNLSPPRPGVSFFAYRQQLEREL